MQNPQRLKGSPLRVKERINNFMKVCIIAHTEKTYLPYMDRYIKFFEENHVDYDIICWQREKNIDGENENDLDFYKKPAENAFSKVSSYLSYRRHVIKTIKQNKYDKLVILTTVPAIFLKNFLIKEYDNKYIFDFRDYSFEKIKPYKKAVDQIIEHSFLTTISSHGFMDFLAENKKIILNHNIPAEYTLKEGDPDLAQKDNINLGFLGVVRYFDESVTLIEQLKWSLKYNLLFVGKAVGSCDLEGYCKENRINNVTFIGKYDNDEKEKLYENIDIINSLYGNRSLEVTTLLPNRLYDACILRKPILASNNTFLGEIVKRYNIGAVIDIEHENISKRIDEYLKDFNYEEFKKGCDEFLADVAADEKTLYRQLNNFID